MTHNRLREYLSEQQPDLTGVPSGFVVCQVPAASPSPLAQVAAQQDLYRQAQAMAQEQVSRSRFSNRLFSVWN